MTSSRLCKYHGRSCTHPGHCLNRAPRKYEGDGHEEHIDPERLELGCVIRRQTNGGRPTFSDNVIIGIHVQYSRDRQMKEKGTDKEHFLTLQEAMTEATRDDYVVLTLARPYLYASNVFGSLPNWLQGVEEYEVMGKTIIDTHKVVVMSTGEYAGFMAKEPLHKWEVIVGNIGTVYDDLSEDAARATYKVYKEISKLNEGRAGGESVVLLRSGEIEEEYVGTEVIGE